MVKIFLSLLLFFSFLSGSGYPDVIAVIVCDTDSNIGDSVKIDLENMRQEASRIALYTGENLQELIFEGQALDPREVLSALKALPSTEQDTVLFFFSGHGYRTHEKDTINHWPNLYLSPSKAGIDFGQVAAILTAGKHRLLLALADCCNNYMEDAVAPPLVKKAQGTHLSHDRVRENYKKLFANTFGEIIVSSSDVSEYSWCNSKGSLFSCAFLDALQAEAETAAEPSWHCIFDSTTSILVKYQTPLVEISIH